MIDRRTFLKSLVAAVGVAAVPTIVKASFFDDIGPRGIGQMTEREYKAVQEHMRVYLDTDNIRWQIPGKSDHCQGVAILDFSYMVTFKPHPRSTSRRIYIEAERMFTGEPSPDLTRHINAVWKQYMNKRTGGQYVT